MKNLIRNTILTLSPYSTARDEYQGQIGVYLDANENPYDNGYNRYPDPYQKSLKSRISEIKGVAAENIFIGNGSDEPIDLLFRVFCEPGHDNVVAIDPTYGMYRVAAHINNIEYRTVRLNPDDFELDPIALLAATDAKTKMIFICSPNNPTGNAFKTNDVEYLIQNFNGIVVIDEAYIDFAECSSFSDRGFDNVVVLQTLSKAWGMAGLRLGLAFGSKLVIDTLTKIKYPYNINIVTQNLVLELLDQSPRPQIKLIISERQRVANALGSMKSIIKVYKSDANFLLVKVDDPRLIYNQLIQEGVIVRDRSTIPGCEGCLRITIGTVDENSKLINIFEKL